MNADSNSEQYFGEYQEVFETPRRPLLIDVGFKALQPRSHPLEAKIAQHEANQLGYYAIEYEGYLNAFADENELVGGLILQRRWNAVYIYSFYLMEAFRGLGLGKRLLELAEELALQMGGKALVLETSTLHTYEFYLNNGFQLLSEVSGYIDGEIWFHMFKDITTETAE